MNRLFLLFLFVAVVNGMEIGIRDVRFIHAIPSGGPVDVYVNGQLLFANQAFQSVTNYNGLLDASDSLTVAVVPAGAMANATLFNKYYSTPYSSSWNLVWRLNSFGVSILDPVEVSECCLRPGNGRASIQALNLDASGNFPVVDISFQGGILFPQLLQNKVSPFTEIRALTLNLKFIGASGAVPLSVDLTPGASYVLVLWGGPNFPPVASATALAGCSIPPLDSPPPPPPPPMNRPAPVTIAEAQAISSQSDREYIAAINNFISGKDLTQLDAYVARWSPARLFSSASITMGTPPVTPNLFNTAQFLSVTQSFLKSIPTAMYDQQRPQLILLNEDSFVEQFSFSFTAGPIPTGFASKVFTRLVDGSWGVVYFAQQFIAASPAVSMMDAQNMATVDMATMIRSFNAYLGAGDAGPLTNYFSTHLAPTYVATDLDISVGTNMVQLNAANQLGLNLQVLGASFRNFTLVLQIQQTFVINENSFVSIGFTTLNSIGQTQLIFFHEIFTRQLDGSFKISAHSQFQGQAVFPISAAGAALLGGKIAQASITANAGAAAGNYNALDSYFQFVLPGYRGFFFPTPNGLPAEPIDADSDRAGWIADAQTNLVPFGYKYYQSNATIIRLSDFSLVEVHTFYYDNGTNKRWGIGQNVMSISPWYNYYGLKVFTELDL